MRELLNAVSRYLIFSPAGKCFQRILIQFCKGNLTIVSKFRFLCRSRKSRSRTRYSISSDFREKQRDLRSLHFRLLGRSRPQYSENRPRDSKFEYAQARGIWPLQDQNNFRIAWRLRTNIKCFKGFDVNFSGHPENWLFASRRWGVENNENSQNAQGRRLSLL